jgi:hypothetical protein
VDRLAGGAGLLRAEMKLPGLAWLELHVGLDDDGRTTYRQRMIFQPLGPARTARSSAGRHDRRRQEDSAAFLIAARVSGMPRWAALVRSAIWVPASGPYRSWKPAMPVGKKFQVSVSVVPPPAGANV